MKGENRTVYDLEGVPKSALREVISLSNPPTAVKCVVSATCMLLGHRLWVAHDWRKQKAVIKSIPTYGVVIPDEIEMDEFEKAKEELKEVAGAEVAMKSNLAIAALFNWAQRRIQAIQDNL